MQGLLASTWPSNVVGSDQVFELSSSSSYCIKGDKSEWVESARFMTKVRGKATIRNLPRMPTRGCTTKQIKPHELTGPETPEEPANILEVVQSRKCTMCLAFYRGFMIWPIQYYIDNRSERIMYVKNFHWNVQL